MCYQVKVNVTKSDRKVFAPIDRTILMPAICTKDGREVIITNRYPNGIHPGIRRGGIWTLCERDL